MDLANVSLDMSCQDLITHSTTSLLGTGFIFPASIYSCFLFASQSYDGGFYDQSISWGLLLNLFSQQWYWRTYRSRQMFVHGNNVGIVKIELLLDSTDVHHHAMIRSTIYDGSFWAVVVFLLREYPCLRINFSHHPRLPTNKSLMAGSSFFSLKMLLAFHMTIFLMTWSILLCFS